MVSGKVCWVAGVIVLASAAMGCPREAEAPEPWAEQPVVVSQADASSITVRLVKSPDATGRDAADVIDRGSWGKTLPVALRTRLEASGFKIAPSADAPADWSLSVQATGIEWTGRYWESHGNLVATLTNAADQANIAQASERFVNLEAQQVPEAVAGKIVDQILRSKEVAAWFAAKHAKEAPPPPPPPTTPPPPPPPPPGLEASAVRPVLLTLRHKYRSCHESGLARDPNLNGTVALDIGIAPEGTVTSVAVAPASTLTDSGITSCVMDAVKGLTFPHAPGKTAVVVPLELAPLPPPEIKGVIEVVEVRKPIHGAHAQIHACFEPVLKKNADLTGTVKLKFSITTKGAILGAEVLKKDSTIYEKEVNKCLLDVVKKLTFSKPKKKVDVIYPIELRGAGG